MMAWEVLMATCSGASVVAKPYIEALSCKLKRKRLVSIKPGEPMLRSHGKPMLNQDCALSFTVAFADPD